MPTDELLGLLLAGARLAAQPGVQAADLDRVVHRILRRDAGVDTAGHAQQTLTAALPPLWEAGWQPADLVHVVGRKVSARASRLAAAVVTAEAVARPAAPAVWTAQVAALGAGARSVGQWWREERIEPVPAWRDVLRVAGLLRVLPRLEQLLPPPSAWTGATVAPPADLPGTDPKVLHRIRALLAKAESTDFPEEAEALTGKAQSLMARHAIDTAVLAARDGRSPAGGVHARRLHLTDPHTEAKAAVVQAVCSANGVRVVLAPSLGIATLVGDAGDVAAVELLVTSLLVQATRAMAEAARDGGARARTSAYKRGFLYSFAQRVDERLTAASEQAVAEAGAAYGASLAPVLASRAAAVDAAVEELFPHVRQRRGQVVDPAGWHAGRLAADAADLGTGRRPLAGG